jgi:hypothetical protein
MATYAATFVQGSREYTSPVPPQPSLGAGREVAASHVYGLSPPPQPSLVAGDLFPDAPAPGGGVIYRMRGFDENVGVDDTVFWDSDHVDATAADYTGSAGPVVDIVVQKKIGS